MADLEILKTRLAEAEAARHRLMTSGTVAEVQYDGRVTRYDRANAASLDTYIRGLRDQIAQAEGAPARRRRAIGVTFG